MLLVIIKKELKRVFSDKSLVFSSFILPAVTIFIIYSIMGTMMVDMFDDNEEHIAKIKVYNAPQSFVDFQNDFVRDDGKAFGGNIEYIEGDLTGEKEKLKTGDVDLVVAFEDDFDNKVTMYNNLERLPQINTYYNPAETYSTSANSKFSYDMLSIYEENLLTQRFGDAKYTKAYGINEYNDDSEVFDEAKATGTGLSMILPMLISIFLFSGAMGIGIDTIAGEKERGTMATLLMTPVSRETIALGKIIGLAVVAILSATCSFIGVIASLPNSGGMVSGGRDIEISTLIFTPIQLIQLLVIMLTLVGIFVGLICMTSAHAKSVKEASTYASPILMVVMLASFSTMFQTGDPAMYQFAVPILGSILALKRLLTFELGFTEFLLAGGVALITTGILVFIITKIFNNEKVMLNA